MSALKRFVFLLLCNQITGFIILSFYKNLIPDLRWPKFRFNIRKELTNYRYIASIFWGFYESAEIRMIEKYLNGRTDVIELGSSLGVVSSHISSKLTRAQKLICVEANPNLIPTIELNVKRHLINQASFFVENCAINYEKEKVQLQLTDNNTETKIQTNLSSGINTISVPTIGISQLKKKYQIEDYALVCDIEGSEVDILVNDVGALDSCMQLIIELHDTTHQGKKYTVSEVEKLFLLNGFVLVDREGPVYCFKRT